jgi:hypothetical protein
LFWSKIINRLLKNLEQKLKSNNPKILSKMNARLRSLLVYFENVLHPAAGWLDNNLEKKKRRSGKNEASQYVSPECFNIRGGAAKKQDKLRRNPAP